MNEPNKSALVLLRREATELLALFDQLRSEVLPPLPLAEQARDRSAGVADPTARVTN
ncbi:hypothetical protein JWH11_01970 [Xanthomonas melonis]|uniref:Uncharacterized protein n=1 Tax=Xanthomonas melonis TaxID=56456 RepID=A0ABS8NQ98_9XANT|nr:hypothetical protein [Xanthomonas melonis]MCD0244697.1 hypothetical protein [Xanthomonas melonis]MCD0256963.1 hypothetical protein [Xanthomonas melonis]MCD0265224.1 hypothetical protein [Xanthomonas melonis]